MNVLEKTIKDANKGELARPGNAVERARMIKELTNNYKGISLEGKKENSLPPIVSGNDIRDEMEKNYRALLGKTEQVETPYLDGNSNPLINAEQSSLEQKDDFYQVPRIEDTNER